ncbi:MAG: ATP synthase F0 subunit B [Candidatus Korobacteraceae bacterium]
MKHLRRLTLASVFLALIIFVTGAWAQQAAPAASTAQPQTQQQPENPNAVIGSELSKQSEEAEHAEEHEENGQFKYSPSVKWFAKHLGLDPHRAYLVSMLINFGLLGLFFWVLLRAKVPAMFRNRTDSIQTAIREARAASAEATERLKAVEARLSKLDSEVTGIRAEAEKQAVAEEQRIHAAAEEDKNRVVESAKMEIDAIARNARRELKSYASTLAVDIAAKRIHVDEHSDQALVREFVDQLGKDGHQ